MRAGERGVTLVEVLVSLGLVGLVAFAAVAVFERFNQGKAVLAAKSDADAYAQEIFARASTYVRTRAVSRPDGGLVVAANRADIYRSGAPDASGQRATEKIHLATVCRPLSSAEATTAARLKLAPAALGAAVEPLCGVRCAVGSRPLVLMRRWPDVVNAPARTVDAVFPPLDRFTEGEPIGAGLCATAGATGVRFLIGVAWGRRAGGFRIELEKKDFAAAYREDASQIEFLPP